MSAYYFWISLGLCPQFVPGDDEATMWNCQMLFEMRHRRQDIIPDDLVKSPVHDLNISLLASR